MKILFASDIHGNTEKLEILVRKCLNGRFDRFVLTGDVTGFFGNGILRCLQPVSCVVSAVMGNCDNANIMKSCNIPVEDDYGVFYVDGFNLFYTHGHIFGYNNNPPGMNTGDVLVCGHTHIPKLECKRGFLFANPGSASRPRGGFVPTYMTYDNGIFEISDFAGNVIMSHKIRQ